MGWERRRGSRYYYRKHRVGSRVVSEYMGRGHRAEHAIFLAQMTHEREQQTKYEDELVQRQLLEVEQQIDQGIERLDRLIRGYLVANGYRTHKGQWRKKRCRHG